MVDVFQEPSYLFDLCGGGAARDGGGGGAHGALSILHEVLIFLDPFHVAQLNKVFVNNIQIIYFYNRCLFLSKITS